jgi:hypothetical protein
MITPGRRTILLMTAYLVSAFGLVCILVGAYMTADPVNGPAGYFEDSKNNYGTWGFVADHSGVIRAVATGSPASSAGLRVGQRLAEPETIRQRSVQFRFNPPGTSRDIRLSDGETKLLRAAPPQVLPKLTQILTVLRCITYGVFVFVGLRLVSLSPSRMNWGMLFYCVFAGAPYGWVGYWGFLPTAKWWVLQASWVGLSFAGNLGLLIFALDFPNGPYAKWAPRLDHLANVIAIPYFLLVALLWSFQQMQYLGDWVPPLIEAVPLAILVASIAALLKSYSVAPLSDRKRLVWIIVAACTGDVLLVARDVVRTFVRGAILYGPHGDFASRVLGILTVSVPVAVLYAARRGYIRGASGIVPTAVASAVVSTACALLFGALENVIAKLTKIANAGLVSGAFVALFLAAMKPVQDAVKHWCDAQVKS